MQYFLLCNYIFIHFILLIYFIYILLIYYINININCQFCYYTIVHFLTYDRLNNRVLFNMSNFYSGKRLTVKVFFGKKSWSRDLRLLVNFVLHAFPAFLKFFIIIVHYYYFYLFNFFFYFYFTFIFYFIFVRCCSYMIINCNLRVSRVTLWFLLFCWIKSIRLNINNFLLKNWDRLYVNQT
jgi:hypothetical protein